MVWTQKLAFVQTKKSSPGLRGPWEEWEESLSRDFSRQDRIGLLSGKASFGFGMSRHGGFPAQSTAVWKTNLLIMNRAPAR